MGLLDGKVAIVTGAGHGIGRGHALELARQGAKVVVNDLGGSVRGEGAGRAADETVALVEKAGGIAVANYGDVSNYEQAAELIQQAVDAFGKLDIVINNAGIVRDAAVWNMPEADFDAVMGVHVKGTWNTSTHAAKYWRAQAKSGGSTNGRIINTTSGAGLGGNFGQTGYATAKAAIVGLTLTLSIELYRLGVTVNAIGPAGLTRITASIPGAGDAFEPNDLGADEYHPMDPAGSSPLAAWLASDDAQYVTGQVIRCLDDRIIWMKGWTERKTIHSGEKRWVAEDLPAIMSQQVFEVRPGGLNFQAELHSCDVANMTTVWSLIEERASKTPDREMLLDEHGRSMTFEQFRAAGERAAAGLFALGIAPGTRVVWQLTTRIDTLVVTAALCRLGAVQIPVLPIYRGRELAFVLGQTKASHVLVAPGWNGIDLASLARDAAVESGAELAVLDGALPAGDPATLPVPPASDQEVRWIFYTSGTTADPKGAMHTDASAIAGGAGMSDGMGITADDRIGMVFPVAHIGGCAVWLTASLLSGCVLVLTEYVKPTTIADLLRETRVTVAGTGPAHHAMYLAAQHAHPGAPYFPDVRMYTSGGAAKPPSHYAMIMKELGKPVHSSFGMTEAPILTSTRADDTEDVLASSEGRANTGVQLRTVSADGVVLGPGEVGEVEAKGPQVMQGYLDSSLDADAFDDGWLRTGDLGTLDRAGNLTITGRIKDVIIRKGETISAREIEDLLITSPEVADVAVVGLPHPVLGEQACACVVPADPAHPPTLASLTAYLDGQGVMKQKWPEHLEIMQTLPRNLAGKVIKADLRALVVGG